MSSDYEGGSGVSVDDSVKCDGSELSIYQCSISLGLAVNNSLAQPASVSCQSQCFDVYYILAEDW